MPPWTHPISPECDPRIYTLSGTAFDRGILTLKEQTLKVETPNPSDIGMYTATVTADIAGIPFLTLLLRKTASFTVKITGRCESTKLLSNVLVNKLTYVGEKPVVWKIDEWQDTYSNSVRGDKTSPFWKDENGPFC